MGLVCLTRFFVRSLVVFMAMFIQNNGLAYEGLNGSEEESRTVTYGGEMDFNSRYVWRGIALSEGAVMQPSIWASAFDFIFEIWGNFVLNGEPDQGEFNEIDLTLYYSREWDSFTFDPSIILYLYPNQEDAPATLEVSLRLSYPVGPFYIFTDHIFDVVEYGGSYYGDAGLSYEHELNSKLSLEASADIAWASAEFNDVNIGVSKNALNVVEVGLALFYYLKDYLYIRPHVELSAIADDVLRDELDDPTILNVGLAVGMEF